MDTNNFKVREYCGHPKTKIGIRGLNSCCSDLSSGFIGIPRSPVRNRRLASSIFS